DIAREIDDAEDQPAHAWGGARDLLGMQHAIRRLDERLDGDVAARQAYLLLDLTQQPVDEEHILWPVDLWDDYAIQRAARLLHHLDQVAVAEAGAHVVDAEGANLAAEV